MVQKPKPKCPVRDCAETVTYEGAMRDILGPRTIRVSHLYKCACGFLFVDHDRTKVETLPRGRHAWKERD